MICVWLVSAMMSSPWSRHANGSLWGAAAKTPFVAVAWSCLFSCDTINSDFKPTPGQTDHSWPFWFFILIPATLRVGPKNWSIFWLCLSSSQPVHHLPGQLSSCCEGSGISHGVMFHLWVSAGKASGTRSGWWLLVGAEGESVWVLARSAQLGRREQARLGHRL